MIALRNPVSKNYDYKLRIRVLDAVCNLHEQWLYISTM